MFIQNYSLLNYFTLILKLESYLFSNRNCIIFYIKIISKPFKDNLNHYNTNQQTLFFLKKIIFSFLMKNN
jgi:hypothetical protein